MNMEKYYGDDNHFALWLDLRTTEYNTLHGSGKALINTNDGIQLTINTFTAIDEIFRQL
jgi:hypothetical protein